MKEEGGAEEEEEEHGVYIDLLRERFDLEIALFDPTDWISAAQEYALVSATIRTPNTKKTMRQSLIVRAGSCALTQPTIPGLYLIMVLSVHKY